MPSDDAATPSLAERYLGLIDQIVTMTLKGQLRSKEQIFQQLAQEVETGTGEIFERGLSERLTTTQTQVDKAPDEMKQARASRTLRALQTIQSEWERLQKEQQMTGQIAAAQRKILEAAPDERLLVWLGYLDANQQERLDLDALKQLAALLDRTATGRPDAAEVGQLTAGMRAGMKAYQQLEEVLIQWIYEAPSAIGFESSQTVGSPWKLWADRSQDTVPKQLFQTIAANRSIAEWAEHLSLEPCDWVELAVLLQLVQQALVVWFEKQPYSSKWGTAQSIATYLVFAAIWSELMNGLSRLVGLNVTHRQQMAQGCFQLLLQILRRFSQQSYFPLYGGVFALFSGDGLKNALRYLDEPLKQVEGTQEKARILTLLGYSQRALGQYRRAAEFHEQALDISRQAGDQACEVASLNHLSRIELAQKHYAEAISLSQRALILARQTGDRLGEANALTNLGYSEVLSAREQDQIEEAIYEMAVNYLQQGLQLAEKLGDRQSQSLCYNSLGIAQVILAQPQQAVAYLEKGVQAAQASGDLYLQGLNFAYLAEAYYGIGEREKAILAAYLGMYLLHQIQAAEWRQPAGLLTISQGQLGAEAFEQLRRQLRSHLISVISVDGYDELPKLLQAYQQSI